MMASGTGSGNCINSSPRSPVKTTPRIASSVCSGPDFEPKNIIGKERTYGGAGATKALGTSVMRSDVAARPTPFGS
jgi:hypothetical protein